MPIFDIFSGQFGDKNAVWIEAVEGLGSAADRMKQLAAGKPGPYFVFSTEKGAVVAAIDTSGRQRRTTAWGEAEQAG
jgi:hypothetical protein